MNARATALVERPWNAGAAADSGACPRREHAADALPPVRSRWRAFWASEVAQEYHCLFALVLAVNAVVLWQALGGGWWQGTPALLSIANVAIANFAVALLIRQHHVINLLFAIATSIPHWAPLWLRRRAGKVYHFGGLHSAGNTCGTLWMAGLLIALWIDADGGGQTSALTLGLSGALLGLLATIIALALPGVRARWHNPFELMHRLGGWTALALFWAQYLSFVADAGALSPGALLQQPGFWALLAITTSVILPWLRLRRVPVAQIKPSNHVALSRFDHGVTPFAGSSTALSLSPLREWHSFANIPAPGERGFRLAISRAGDWTGAYIDHPPTHVWTKAVPTAGVGNVDKLFKRVVWVATGSGIGPTLPHLLAGYTPAHLIWSTRAPRETYGDALVEEILAAEPESLIWDTTADGKPDLPALAWQMVRRTGAEAVIVIANRKLTWAVVSAMEARGVPAYGAIWDS